jgi:hypothetical protein
MLVDLQLLQETRLFQDYLPFLLIAICLAAELFLVPSVRETSYKLSFIPCICANHLVDMPTISRSQANAIEWPRLGLMYAVLMNHFARM